MFAIQKRYAAYAIWLIAGYALAQEPSLDRLTATFSDPSKPGEVEVSLINGGISITGYDGKEVYIESSHITRPLEKNRDDEKAKGMHRLVPSAAGIEVEEESNQMTITVGSLNFNQTVDLTLRVPFKTSLKLTTVNNGNIKVENVDGEMEIQNVNGSVTLNNVSGSVVANTVNRDIQVVFNRIDPQKPMSFSTMNGNIDVTFPAAIKADLLLKSEMGEVYTDFDTQLKEKADKIEENNRDQGGKFKIKIDRAFHGQINGGGPEYQFTSFNGDIYLRKK